MNTTHQFRTCRYTQQCDSSNLNQSELEFGAKRRHKKKQTNCTLLLHCHFGCWLNISTPKSWYLLSKFVKGFDVTYLRTLRNAGARIQSSILDILCKVVDVISILCIGYKTVMFLFYSNYSLVFFTLNCLTSMLLALMT